MKINSYEREKEENKEKRESSKKLNSEFYNNQAVFGEEPLNLEMIEDNDVARFQMKHSLHPRP